MKANTSRIQRSDVDSKLRRWVDEWAGDITMLTNPGKVKIPDKVVVIGLNNLY